MACWKSNHKTQTATKICTMLLWEPQGLPTSISLLVSVLCWFGARKQSYIGKGQYESIHNSLIVLYFPLYALPSYEEEQKWFFCLTRLYPGDKFKWQQQGGRAVCGVAPKHSSLPISTQQITWPLRVDVSLCLWVSVLFLCFWAWVSASP